MGDCALVVPVLLALQEQYPKVQFTVVSKPFFSTIFGLVNGINIVQADTKREYKGFWGVVKLGRQLSRRNFTKVADLHNVLRSTILRMQLALHRIPSAKIDKGRGAKKALTRLENKQIHPVQTTPERYAQVFRELGFPLDLSESVFLDPLDLSAKAEKKLADKASKIIGIAPFAAHQSKTYPIDLMKQVIALLESENDCEILLFGGGAAEVKLLADLEKEFLHTTSTAGELSFKEELQLISRLDVMLSMDSGNGHLAAMFGVPVVTLWGGTHPFAGFAPYGQPDDNQLLPDRERYPFLPTSVYGNKIVPGYEDVMRTILPEQVVQRIREILKNTKPENNGKR